MSYYELSTSKGQSSVLLGTQKNCKTHLKLTHPQPLTLQVVEICPKGINSPGHLYYTCVLTEAVPKEKALRLKKIIHTHNRCLRQTVTTCRDHSSTAAEIRSSQPDVTLGAKNTCLCCTSLSDEMLDFLLTLQNQPTSSSLIFFLQAMLL